MKVRWLVIVCLFVFSVTALADEVVLSNPKALFSAERIKNRSYSYPLLAARLSPSGKHLIYPKLVPAGPPDYETTFKLMVYEIATGKEKPIELNLPGGYESVYTDYNFFNPAGDKLVVTRYSKIENRHQGEIMVYDINKAKLTSTGIKDYGIGGVFDNTGENIFLWQRGETLRKVAMQDFSIKSTSMTGFCHTQSPTLPYSSMYIIRRTLKRKYAFELWNLKTKKKIGDLPVHEKNTSLDDVQGVWTADGRYLLYLDFYKHTGNKVFPVARVWDAVNNEQKTELLDARTVGVGPTKSTVVMVGVDGNWNQTGMFVYDVKSKEYMDIGPRGAKAVHACGSKLLYVLKKDGEDMVYAADVSIVESEAKSGKSK